MDDYDDKLNVFASNLAFGPPLQGLDLPWFQHQGLEEAVMLAILSKLDTDLLEGMGEETICVDRRGLIHHARITVKRDIVRLERVESEGSACGCKSIYRGFDLETSYEITMAVEAWRQTQQDLGRLRLQSHGPVSESTINEKSDRWVDVSDDADDSDGPPPRKKARRTGRMARTSGRPPLPKSPAGCVLDTLSARPGICASETSRVETSAQSDDLSEDGDRVTDVVPPRRRGRRRARLASSTCKPSSKKTPVPDEGYVSDDEGVERSGKLRRSLRGVHRRR
ncbi:hypothetical protein V5O48_013704 [Marasmius crinis-equi]|uniref:Uncharacterized protein n=1 Tax=Marasmius crinis-equi TaxID=585013 RepID=A0ABR3EZC7_9AGAR